MLITIIQYTGFLTDLRDIFLNILLLFLLTKCRSISSVADCMCMKYKN